MTSTQSIESPKTFIRKGSIDPAYALMLIERTDEFVVVAPYHGGFTRRILNGVFEAEYAEVDLSGLYHMRKAKFSVDGSHPFEGYTDGRVWNGWACPWAGKAVAVDFLRKVCTDGFEFSQLGDTLRVTDSNYPDDPIDLTPQSFKIEGESVLLWNLGELGWCFDEDEI